MIEISLAQIRQLLDSQLSPNVEQPSFRFPNAVVNGRVVIDSREVRAGDLFVALPGERADGADFIPMALAAGAVGVVTSTEFEGPVIIVSDPVRALGSLAHGVAGLLSDLTVIGITGSTGKTSTKDLLAQILALVAPTIAPKESFNNEIGLPLTVLRSDKGTRYLVLELGARGPGHLRYLCGIAPPNAAVVLNVGTAHLGEFGDRAAIAAAKAEIVTAVQPGGVVLLNADDPLVLAMRTNVAAGVRIITFAQVADADVSAGNVQLDEQARASFDLSWNRETERVQLQLVGAHQVANALAAASVCFGLGIPIAAVAAGLRSATAQSKWRMQVSETADGVIVVNDAYNANPESMRAALTSLVVLGRGRPTWAVLGEMRELGPESAQQHELVGALVAEVGIDRLVVVGSPALPMYEAAAKSTSWRGQAVFVDSVAAAEELVLEAVRSGDVVLVKASRAVGLEAVAETLERRSRP